MMTLNLHNTLYATLNALFLIALLIMAYPEVKFLVALFVLLMTKHPITHLLSDEIIPVR